MKDWKETIREVMNEKILEAEKALDMLTSNNLLYMSWVGRLASLRNALEEFEKTYVNRHDCKNCGNVPDEFVVYCCECDPRQ